MRLNTINETKTLSSSELVTKLVNFGISANSYSEHAVEIWKIPINKLQAIQRMAKHYGWQIHKQSIIVKDDNGKDAVHISLSKVRPDEVNAPEVLYHITDKSRVDNILQNGIHLRSETPDMAYPKRIYVYPNIDTASNMLKAAKQLNRFANKGNFNPVLLTINNRFGKYRTYIDPETFMNAYASDNPSDYPLCISRPVDPQDVSVYQP